MGRRKGETGNPHGRPPGVPNKVTAVQREWIEKFLSKHAAQAERDWLELSPAERWRMFEKLLGYIVPKQQAVTTNIDNNLFETLLKATGTEED